MRMTYGPAQKRNPNHKKRPKHHKTNNFIQNIDSALENSKLSLNTILGIVLIVLFAGCIGGYIILNTIDTKESNSQARNDSKPTIIVNAESQNENMITIPNIQSMIAEYNVADITEGDMLDVSKIDLIVTYDDNRTIVAHNGQFHISENVNDPLIAGNNFFQITYNGNKCVLNIIAQPNTTLGDKISKYSNEFSDADIKYVSDDLWITGKKYAADDIYWLFHIICSPDNTPRAAMSNKEYKSVSTILQNEQTNGWTFAVNASYHDKNYNPAEGLYMNNGKAYGDITTTSGNELCITTDGLLFTPDPGLSIDNLLAMNVVDTILSDNPVLIKDGKVTNVPTAYLDNINTKTVIAMKDKGEYYIILAADGMYTNYNSYNTITKILLDKHCTYAKAVSSASNVTAALNEQIVITPPLDNRSLIDVFAFYEFAD